MVCQKHSGYFEALLTLAQIPQYARSPYARQELSYTRPRQEQYGERTQDRYSKNDKYTVRSSYTPSMPTAPTVRSSGWYTVIEQAPERKDNGGNELPKKVYNFDLPTSVTTEDDTSQDEEFPIELLRQTYEAITESPVRTTYQTTRQLEDKLEDSLLLDKKRAMLASQVIDGLKEFEHERTPHVHENEKQLLYIGDENHV